MGRNGIARNGSAVQTRAAEAFARNIIGRVSRTFAIGIAVLPGHLGRAVLVGYLLCRIADTIEDDGDMPSAQRQALLAQFLDCFNDSSRIPAFVSATSGVKGDGHYLELLRGTQQVFDLLHSLPEKSAAIVEHWTRELALGMSAFVGRYPSGIRIQTVREYKEYCYYVAGTVGHLLTELFHYHSSHVRDRDFVRMLPNCEAFGELLQNVNIIKDIPWDAEHENNVYVPEELLHAQGSSQQQILSGEWTAQNRAAIVELVALAKADLQRSLDYFNDIPKFAVRIRLFCLLPILFAVATLREIERSSAMLESGGAVKISRSEVRSLILAGSISTISNKTTRWLVSKTARARFKLGFAKP